MNLTESEMEAKLAALEDRIALLLQAVDRLEIRLDRKDEVDADWALILRAAAKVVENGAGRMADWPEDSGIPAS